VAVFFVLTRGGSTAVGNLGVMARKEQLNKKRTKTSLETEDYCGKLCVT
jgi:hypothetical protein